MKKHFLILTILILIIGIFLVQYRIHKVTETKLVSTDNKISSNQVKGAFTKNLDLRLPEIKDIQLVKYPSKKPNAPIPQIYADSYILIDQKTNQPLIEKNSDKIVSIASTTKIMTAIIALENFNLDDVIEISQNAASQIGSDVYLKTGEKITVKDLLKAMLIKSGNDSAMALAEHYNPGGLNEFINKMNEKAKYLGLKSTSYKDPAGLNDEGHSTAFDLAILTSYAINNPVFAEIIKTQKTDIISIDGKYSHELKNSNRLIDPEEPLYYQFAIGVKTGFTPYAGHCLVSAASNNNATLIGVVLHTNQETNDASAKESKKLLEWGYNSFNF